MTFYDISSRNQKKKVDVQYVVAKEKAKGLCIIILCHGKEL